MKDLDEDFPKPQPGNKPGATYGVMEPKSLGTGPSGWVIERCCDQCKGWRIMRNNPPGLLTGFGTWEEARDALIEETYGRHDRATLGMAAVVTYKQSWRGGDDYEGCHRPAEDRWDASWLLAPSRIVLSDNPPMYYVLGDAAERVQRAQNVVRWNLSLKGWLETYGAEVVQAFGKVGKKNE